MCTVNICYDATYRFFVMYSTPLCLTHSCDRSIVRETARPGEDASQVLKCYLALYSPNSTAYSLDESLIPTGLFNCLQVPYSNCFIQLLIPWMSPLFQLFSYSLDESLIPTGLFNCLFPG